VDFRFSQREPEVESAGSGRDVFNERPAREQLLTAGVSVSGVSGSAAAAATRLGLSVQAGLTIHTSMGDISVQLFPEETPKTCENFVTHAKNGYYNNILFHRVIKVSNHSSTTATSHHVSQPVMRCFSARQIVFFLAALLMLLTLCVHHVLFALLRIL